jgi:nucleoid-associated protein YgaU
MPNDAKLGLVVGVGLVIAVAVVFFRKDGSQPRKTLETSPPAVARDAVSLPPSRPPTSNPDLQLTEAPERRHTVVEGDSLFSLAQQYYGDGERFIDIYRANRDMLATPDHLPPGASLRIPK